MKLSSQPMLAYAKIDKLFTIHISAVSHDLGAVLYQGYGGQKKVNEYVSSGLKTS